jgi:porin
MKLARTLNQLHSRSDMANQDVLATSLRKISARVAVALAAAGGLVAPVFAQTAPATPDAASGAAAPSDPPPPVAAGANAPSAPTGFWDRSNLLGDMGGLRTLLGNHGVTFNLQETSEAYGNFSGGVSKGLSYNGATQFGLSVDTAKAIGLPGGQFFVDALQIHGHGITAARLNALQNVSGVEADATTRLWELWYQQSFGDKFDVKIGQQSLDQEFIVSQYAGTFINATFGWPVLPSVDLPAGGPGFV